MSKSEGIGESEASDSKYSHKLPEVTESEEAEIREEFEEFILPTNSNAGTCNSRLHLPAEKEDHHALGEEYKRTTFPDTRAVPVAAFPPGYRDICRYCVLVWRENR